MSLIRAIKAFWLAFKGSGECNHTRVNLNETPSFCPDCGYRIKLEWLFTLCRGCNAKRIPKQGVLGDIRPLHAFCRHCGHEGFKIIAKSRIDAYELLYAIATKRVAYEEEVKLEPPVSNPFKTTATVDTPPGVVDGEVLRKTEYRGTKSAFKAAPYDFNRRQNAGRYGGQPGAESNIIPLRKLG